MTIQVPTQNSMTNLQKEIFTISEYDGFSLEKPVDQLQVLDSKRFSSLEDFVLSAEDDLSEDVSVSSLMRLRSRKGVKTITAQNYVGVISLPCGLTVEILPKIYSQEGVSEESARSTLIMMLQKIKHPSFDSKQFKSAGLDLKKMNLLEIFIKMLLVEIRTITMQGLRSGYKSVKSNENFYRGRLLVPQDIRTNVANKAKFFIQYDEFSVDRPENRILKLALKHVRSLSTCPSNSRLATQLLHHFYEVGDTSNYTIEFDKCVSNRNMQSYKWALEISRVFLDGSSYTPTRGRKRAMSLLFPMEKIFENYIAELVARNSSSAQVTTQGKGHSRHLFDRFNDNEEPTYKLQPDILIGQQTGETILLDTKWKVLYSDHKQEPYKPSQADMYQMYTYLKRYEAKKAVLVYPLPHDSLRERRFSYTSSQDDCVVEVAFVDLTQGPQESIMHLID